jgi:hypothetical protein
VHFSFGVGNTEVADPWEDPTDQRQRTPHQTKREALILDVDLCTTRTAAAVDMIRILLVDEWLLLVARLMERHGFVHVDAGGGVGSGGVE